MSKENIPNISNATLTSMLNKSIGFLIEDFTKIVLKDFSSVKNIFKIALYQKKAVQTRNQQEENGVHIPPFMIASITSTCNLKCKGCYDREKCHTPSTELVEEDWSNLFSQARELGISFILLAGGEPLIKESIIKACMHYPEIIFPLFTNGLLINKEWVDYFASSRNIVPVLSIEGDCEQTNKRRGEGVFEKVSYNMELLRKRHIFYGISLTVTSENINRISDEQFIEDFFHKGCRLFFFIEYIPFDPRTENLVLTEDQRLALDKRLNVLRKKFRGLFLAFPGDEKSFGGCLAAGRGFIHINASGAVEACPFAPYSDVNLKNMSLKEALNSPLLDEIRNFHGLLEDHKGGCALFDNKELLEKKIII